MSLETQFTLKSNEQYITYLRSHSYWYKELNRNPEKLRDFIEEVRVFYKLRTSDRIEKAIETVEFLESVLSTMQPQYLRPLTKKCYNNNGSEMI